MMTLDALVAWLHFLAIFATVALLAVEFALTSDRHLPNSAALLSRIDLFYFAAAITALATGLLRLFFGAKGADFYIGNPWFWTKLGAFVLIGLLSIPPTLQFARWAKQARTDHNFQPNGASVFTVRRWIKLELILLLTLPAFAALMSRGIGLA